MMKMLKKLILWFFVIVLGITFGAGIYEARVVVPDWINPNDFFWNADEANRSDTGLRFWVYVTSIPLTLLTLASLVLLFFTDGKLRTWWAIAAGAALIDRVMTFGYFVPTMLKLMDHGNSFETDIVKTAIFWADINYLRIAFVLLAWLAALKALTLLNSKSTAINSSIED
jgi:hypothetical protein